MSFSHWICGLLCLFFVNMAHGSPADEMQKFIDECNYMIDEMSHCAEGWVNLEEEMVASVESFADKIVYTETLILEETELILDMADRIVQTEVIMIDLVESCDCKSPGESREIGKLTHTHEHRNKTRREKRSSVPEVIPFIPTTVKNVLPPSTSEKDLIPFNESVTVDKCSVMDDIIEVMDACIDAFVVYNDDFLQVLNYMDAAIVDMGTRIVNTECLIVNMSYQIGDMADLIVETEVLMADMAASCCRGAEQSSTLAKVKSTPLVDLHSKTGDDDLLTNCDFDPSKRHDVKFNSKHALSLAVTARGQLQHKLQSLPPLVQQVGRVSYLKKTLLPAVAVSMASTESSTSALKDMMPCDTWWDPFCCAAEVCADMMVEMIEMMADGADWMEEVCEDCIDLIGILADDIVKTEENIILMGYAIADMAEYIVVFIDEGLEFMVIFCPDTKKTYSLRGDFQVKKDVSEATLSNLKEGRGVQLKTFVAHMMLSPNQTFTRQTLSNDVSKVVADKVATMGKIHTLQQMSVYFNNLQDNPFGEFVAMVDVMMEAMALFTTILADQMRLMTDLFDGLMSMSIEEGKLAGMVVSMGEDVITLGGDLQDEEALMDELEECL